MVKEGSLNHIIAPNGTFTIKRVTTPRGARETLLECVSIVTELIRPDTVKLKKQVIRALKAGANYRYSLADAVKVARECFVIIVEVSGGDMDKVSAACQARGFVDPYTEGWEGVIPEPMRASGGGSSSVKSA